MSDNKVIRQRLPCKWCGKPNVLVNNVVCTDCCVLLVRAGIEKEEIFKDLDKKAKKS